MTRQIGVEVVHGKAMCSPCTYSLGGWLLPVVGPIRAQQLSACPDVFHGVDRNEALGVQFISGGLVGVLPRTDFEADIHLAQHLQAHAVMVALFCVVVCMYLCHVE